MRIRLAKPEEREALEALQRRASLHNAGDRDALLAHPDAIALPGAQIANGHVYVCEQDRAILGFASVIPSKDAAELDALFVEPTHWRRGVGRALVVHCCSVSGAHGATTLNVIGNPHARAFYEALDFQIVGAAATRFGMGLRMSKRLQAC